MDAHQCLLVRDDVALDEREMRRVGELVAEHRHLERAATGVNGTIADALDQPLVLRAIVDEVGDRADFQAMLLGERDQVGQSRHRTVVAQDLADHRRRREPGQRGEIAASLGVTGAHEHAAFLRHDRKNMTGLDDVGRLRAGRDSDLDRPCAIRRRDARGDARSSLDRDGEIRPVDRLVVIRHRRQVELPAARFGECQADETAGVLRHEVDRLGRHEVGAEHQIAFILAILLVDEDDHASCLELVYEFGNRCEGHEKERLEE